jgi:hypothetical protein
MEETERFPKKPLTMNVFADVGRRTDNDRDGGRNDRRSQVIVLSPLRGKMTGRKLRHYRASRTTAISPKQTTCTIAIELRR